MSFCVQGQLRFLEANLSNNFGLLLRSLSLSDARSLEGGREGREPKKPTARRRSIRRRKTPRALPPEDGRSGAGLDDGPPTPEYAEWCNAVNETQKVEQRGAVIDEKWC